MINKYIKAVNTILVTTLTLLMLYSSYSIENKENITLTIRGEEILINTFSKTVQDLLDENNVNYDSNDIISPSLETELKDGMKVSFTEIEKVTRKEFENVPFTTNIIEDSEVLKGKEEIEQEGIDGKKESTYELTYVNGVFEKEELVDYKLSKTPTTKVVKQGTKEPVVVVSRGESPREESSSSSKNEVPTSSATLTFESTAYYTGHITATGTKPRWGVIAVDPKVIPYGTKVYIPAFDMVFVAEDCGGAIKGNIIDIYMNSRTEAINWGRRNIQIQILK